MKSIFQIVLSRLHMPVGTTKRQKYARGAASVELALLILPLVLLSIAAVEYARLIFTYQSLLKAVREGARYMSTFDPSAIGYATAVANAKNRVVYGQNSAVGAPIVVGLTPARVCI